MRYAIDYSAYLVKDRTCNKILKEVNACESRSLSRKMIKEDDYFEKHKNTPSFDEIKNNPELLKRMDEQWDETHFPRIQVIDKKYGI